MRIIAIDLLHNLFPILHQNLLLLLKSTMPSCEEVIVAVARKLAVVMHRMLVDKTEFCY